MEFGVIILICLYLCIGILMTFIYELIFRDRQVIFFGYHLHHSLYGILFFMVSGLFLLHDATLWFVPATLGAGVIGKHTHLERKIAFIEKHDDFYYLKYLKRKWML